ncbi:MAG TPA: M15 family metallopeptidase, partial [Capsulimonadaceae bacterium]|nr:M15 family metallopeptidase [Capsulimonadaceae bacterium]
ARSFGEPLTKLRAIPAQDNGEPLVDPCAITARLHFAAKHPKFFELNDRRTPNVRKRVAEMLAKAADSLPVGIDIVIVEGYRPLAQQRMMYEHLRNEFARKHPEWSKATLNRVTNTMSAPPDDKSPPPHTTGAAVDLCLIDPKTGEWLDMTSPYEWDETSAPTKMKGLSAEAQKNRDLLIKTLEATGLTNYAGEWWHWSYGDQGWALRTGAPKAIYDRLPEQK